MSDDMSGLPDRRSVLELVKDEEIYGPEPFETLLNRYVIAQVNAWQGMGNTAAIEKADLARAAVVKAYEDVVKERDEWALQAAEDAEVIMKMRADTK